MRRHAARLGADEAHERGLADQSVGALAAIGADHAGVERVVAADRILAVERCRDRNAELLRQRHELRPRARGAHTAARDDDRPLGRLERSQCRAHGGIVRLRPERRHARELRLGERLHLGLVGVDLPLVAAELQVHRPRRARDGYPKGLAQHVGKALDRIDIGVPLGHRLERRHVVDLLIDLAELGARIAPAGHADDRRMRQPRIAQSRGEVHGAHHLRHADAGPSRGAREAIGHIDRGLLAMRVDALDLGAPLDLGHAPAQHRRHHEDVRDAIGVEHLRHHLRARDLCHCFRPPASRRGDCVGARAMTMSGLRAFEGGSREADLISTPGPRRRRRHGE